MQRFFRAITILCLVLALGPSAARAQELYSFTVSLLGGIGGSPDADPGDSLDNLGWQAGFSFVAEPGTHVGLRVGRMGVGSGDAFGTLTGADLTYATIGGEYRFRETYYDSGVYLALGGYQVSGTRPGGGSRDDRGIGVALGLTGEFKITRRLGFLIELSGHYADLNEAQIFAMGHAGLAYHF